METLHQIFASLNIFSSLIHIFPSVFMPLVHGFQSLFVLAFSSMKHMVSLNPGLIFGTGFIAFTYFLVSLFSRLQKVRA